MVAVIAVAQDQSRTIVEDGTNDHGTTTNRHQGIIRKAVVVDICGADEFAAGHVVGAKHVPLDQLEAKLSGMVKNKATPLVLVCASGMRSKRALAVAKKLGFENVRSLPGLSLIHS